MYCNKIYYIIVQNMHKFANNYVIGYKYKILIQDTACTENLVKELIKVSKVIKDFDNIQDIGFI